MNSISTFSQCHCSHTIVLWYDNISFMADTNQFIIYCICSCTDNNNFTISRWQNMVCITQQHYRNTIIFCNLFNDRNHWAGICINKYLHLSISPLNHYKNKLCCSYFPVIEPIFQLSFFQYQRHTIMYFYHRFIGCCSHNHKSSFILKPITEASHIQYWCIISGKCIFLF